MEEREDPMIFSAVLTTLLTFFQSEALQPPFHAEKTAHQDAFYCASVEFSEDGRDFSFCAGNADASVLSLPVMWCLQTR